MKYNTDNFFDYLYSKRKNEPLSSCRDTDELHMLSDDKYIRLHTALGLDKLENMYSGVSVSETGDNELCLEILPELLTPLWILEPKCHNGKTVLYLPGHDKYGARGSFSDYGQKDPFHKWLPLKLRESGYRVLVPELIGFGETIKEIYSDGYKGCYAHSELLLMHGMTLAGLRTFQAQCVMDAAAERFGTDSFLVYGVSGGGFIASLLISADSRIEAAVISNYGASFRTSIMSMEHCVDNYIPGILDIGECADIIGLGAPLPLLLTNGKNDRIFPHNGVCETADELKKIYTILGKPENFVNHTHNGIHETDTEAVIEFFSKFS